MIGRLSPPLQILRARTFRYARLQPGGSPVSSSQSKRNRRLYDEWEVMGGKAGTQNKGSRVSLRPADGVGSPLNRTAILTLPTPRKNNRASGAYGGAEARFSVTLSSSGRSSLDLRLMLNKPASCPATPSNPHYLERPPTPPGPQASTFTRARSPARLSSLRSNVSSTA